MKIEIEDFLFKKCDSSCFNEVLVIQSETFDELIETDILRHNSESMLRKCLFPPHVTLGAWYGGVLTAFSILYFPQDEDEENLSLYLEKVDVRGLKTANKKLCIVRKDFRGNSLQYELARRLEPYAIEAGVGLICTTVSPKNLFSINSILRLGFTYNRTLIKYGFERSLYYKFI